MAVVPSRLGPADGQALGPDRDALLSSSQPLCPAADENERTSLCGKYA